MMGLCSAGCSSTPSEALSRAAKAADQRRVLFECAARVHAPPAAWRAAKGPAEQALPRGALFFGSFLGASAEGEKFLGASAEGEKFLLGKQNLCCRALSSHLDTILKYDIINRMKAKHAKTLDLIFSRPVSGNVRWGDVAGLLAALGAEIVEAEGSRVRVFLFNEVKVLHRPHPSPALDKGAVASLRDWLEANGVKP